MTSLQIFTDKEFEDMLALMKDESSGWELCNDGPEIRVWRRPDKKNKALIVLRASITVQAKEALDPEDVMAVWRDIDYRFSWDDRCAQNLVHEVIGEDPGLQNEVGYYEGKAPPPLSNRDFVLQCGWRQRWQGAARWLYMNKSVEHPNFPEVKGLVRGLSHITGVEIAQEADGQVTITYVTNGDVGNRSLNKKGKTERK